MKVFINDWDYDIETFDTNKQENKEYTINEWITDENGNRIYLVSAYLYDDFVMFFYMYEFQQEDYFVRMGKRNEYEINHLKQISSRGSSCMQKDSLNMMPYQGELLVAQKGKYDEVLLMQEGEYDYLYSLMEKTGGIPEELKDKVIAFNKYCVSFEKHIDEINHISIYPEIHRFNRYYVGKTFKVTYGTCDIKISYTPDTGEESYFIAKELKIYNMLEEFDANYEKFEERHEKALRDYEENKDKYPKNHEVIGSMEEIRNSFDAKVLALTILKPEKRRSFTFYSNTKSAAPTISTDNSTMKMARTFLFTPDNDDNNDNKDLHKSTLSLGEVYSEPYDEYEITLDCVVDSYDIERKSIFEKSFS